MRLQRPSSAYPEYALPANALQVAGCKCYVTNLMKMLCHKFGVFMPVSLANQAHPITSQEHKHTHLLPNVTQGCAFCGTSNITQRSQIGLSESDLKVGTRRIVDEQLLRRSTKEQVLEKAEPRGRCIMSQEMSSQYRVISTNTPHYSTR